MAPTRTVALLFGGRSSEHSVSCATAAGVLAAIDRSRYEVVPVGITRGGAFVLENDDPDAFALRAQSLPEVVDNGTRIVWPPDAATRTLAFTSPDGSPATTVDVDVVFPLLHGRWGEDGTVQGLLEVFGLPFVGAGVLASAVAMDKHFTKSLLSHQGMTVADWTTLERREWARDPQGVEQRVRAVGSDLFVKPARAGSSVGVSRVRDLGELPAALEAAFAEDARVVVEEAVPGREIEVAVLGGRNGGPARASVAGEIVVGGTGFYDFESKYLDAGGVDLVCPARLTSEQSTRVRELALQAFEAISAEGLARVDFFLTDEGFVLNEVNTMPGFTPISMFPRCWHETGLDYTALLTELIESALEGHTR